MGVLAHQGGWDEILLILGPMAAVVLLLRLARRRVERNLATTQSPNTQSPKVQSPNVQSPASDRTSPADSVPPADR